jgi:hypothetical protein
LAPGFVPISFRKYPVFHSIKMKKLIKNITAAAKEINTRIVDMKKE